MPTISPEVVERYQIELAKNPNSRVFAPLAEAYRQMGMAEEALRICTKGVQHHPDFAGGRVTLGRLFIDRKEWDKALTQVEKAAQLAPDNLLAHSLMGEALIELRRPKEALNAFKMVLFISPNDDRALKAVRKWEFLSADEYDDELFKLKPVFQAPKEAQKEAGRKTEKNSAPTLQPEPNGVPAWRTKELDRALSLADAFTVRGDLEKAINILEDAAEELGRVPELDKRLSLLSKQAARAGLVRGSDVKPELPTGPDLSDMPSAHEIEMPHDPELQAQIDRRRIKLQALLLRVHQRRA